MCKRKYTHLKIWEAEIVEMKKAGRTKREIADHFGLTKEQVKDLLKRYRASGKKNRSRTQSKPCRSAEKRCTATQ